MILGEIGDIRRFSRPNKVLKYALMHAAHNVVKKNTTFKDYYNKKMAEDRTHYNTCASKLVSAIWKMLTDGIEFNLG